MRRRAFVVGAAALPVYAHHGWSSFDQTRPVWIEGKATKVVWRNPHAELEIELPADFRLPADLARRSVPAQASPVDGPGLLKAAQPPRRKDRRWTVELAPISRMEAWKVAEIKPGETVGVLGYTSPDEKGEAVVRAEYLFVGGKAYGLRSSPA